MLSARTATSSSRDLVCIEIELPTQAAADEIIGTYNGIVADGNTLRVEVVRQSLGARLGGGGGGGGGAGRPSGGPRDRHADVDMGMDVDDDTDRRSRTRDVKAEQAGRELMGSSSSR